MRSDNLPDLKYLEEPRSQRATGLVRRPWWLLVVGVAAPPIAVALFCSACRWRPRPAVDLQNGNSDAKAARAQGPGPGRTEVLVAYAGDAGEEVLPLLEALRKRRDIKLLDLHDPRALGKRQDPTAWLAKKLLDDSTKALIVASKGARAVQQLVEAGSKQEVRSTGDQNNSCESPKHLELGANKEEVGEGEGEEEGRGTVERMEGGEEEKGREGGEEGKRRDRREKEEEPNNLKIPDSRNGSKDLKGEDVSREERGRKEDARNGRRKNEREQVYHFLLVDFLQKMRNEQFDVCQVLMESTPTTDLLDDIPKTRVYRWPEHEDRLLSALRA
nr:uncharacterized protein LOC113823208 [Penaeus vannamei]